MAPGSLATRGRCTRASRWLIVLFALMLPSVVDAQRSRITRVPVGYDVFGSFGTLSTSADGRFLAYHIVTYEGATQGEIWVRDRLTGELSSLGLASSGGTGWVGRRSISDDGRFLVFNSDATTLVPGDTNNRSDVFLYDRQTRQYRRVSVGPAGQQSVGDAWSPSISGDGRYVAFIGGGDMLPGSGFSRQLFIYDRTTQTLTLASRRFDGTPGDAETATISRDGRTVAFTSYAELVAADTNGTSDTYVFDRTTGAISLASVSATGTQSTAHVGSPDVSGNGRFVTWEEWGDGTSVLPGDTNTVADVIVRDRDADQDGIFDEPGTTRLFRASESDTGVVGNGGSSRPFLSDSGNVLVFVSSADNLLGPVGDGNRAPDVFVVDLDGDGDGVALEPGDRRIARVSESEDGFPLPYGAYDCGLAADGKLVFFPSDDNTIVPGDPGAYDFFVVDRAGWAIRDLITATTIAQTPQADQDGTWVAFASPVATLVSGDTNGLTDVFVRDRRKPLGQPGATVRLSVATDGTQAIGGPSDQPSISADGRFVVFRSAATNLVTGDTNGVADIFVHDRDADQDGVYDEPGARATIRVNIGTGNVSPVGGASETPRISADGRYIVYSSLASNLTPGASPFRQVYFHDRVNRITLCVSQREGVKANADAVTPTVSNTGRVAFATTASNLSSFDGNGLSDIYDTTVTWPYSAPRVLNLVTKVNGIAGPGASTQPALSAGGRLVFTTTTNFSFVNTTFPFSLVYLEGYVSFPPYTTKSLYWFGVSHGLNTDANGASFAPSVAEQGGDLVISFTSSASNLVYGDTNGVDDVFRVRITTALSSNDVYFEQASRASRVSLNPNGTQATVPAGVSSVSADGTHVEFEHGLPGASLGGGVVGAPLVTDGKSAGNGPAALITALSPRSGPEAGGTVVTLVGIGLADPGLVPTLGGVPMTVVEREANFIRALTPPGVGTRLAGLNGPPDIGKSVNSLAFIYVSGGACTVTGGPAIVNVPASGGPFDLSVSDAQNCGWTARSDVDWISHLTGQGTGVAGLGAQQNPDSSARRGHVSLGASTIEVVQAGGGCTYDLADPGVSVGPSASAVSVLLRTPAGCGWNAVPNGPWLSVVGAPTGIGSMVLTFDIAENNAATPRSGAIDVMGRTFAIAQAGEAFWTLTVSRSPGGRVSSQPAGIDCGATCASGFSRNSTVTLTAVADAGYAFDGWGGACTGVAGCVVSMSGDRLVFATFREAPPTPQTLSVMTTGAGVVTSSPAGIACEPNCSATFQNGTTVSLVASPASGWRFGGWSGAGCGATVQMTEDRACSATFEREATATHALSIAFAGSGGGRVTSSPGGIDCTANCTQPFPARTTIVLTPIPAAGSVFRGWSGDPACISGALQIVQPTNCTATFDSSNAPMTLEVSASGNGRVRSVPTGIDCAAGQTCNAGYPRGTVVRLVGIPAPGHALQSWSSASCPDRGPCLVQMTEPRRVTAGFAVSSGQPIAITSISPRSGLAVGGTKIRIVGRGFDQLLPVTEPGVRAAPSVTIGGTPALAADVLSDTEIVAVTGPAPAAAAVVHVGAATVVDTSDVTVNVAGSLAALPGAWRSVTLDGSATTDTDADGMPDQYEVAYSLDPLVADGAADADGDGASNLQEYQAGTHPQGRFTRYLAEGATGTFFDTRIVGANPFTVPATTLWRFQTQSPVSPSVALTIPGEGRRYVYPSQLPTMQSANFGTVVESDVEIAVDRQMFWNANIYGSHAGTSVDAPSTTWYLAEGATHGRFDLFYLLANPSTQDAEVRIRFLRPTLPPVERTYRVLARQRLTLYVDEIPELVSTDVSGVIESTNGVPIIVERSMYVTSPTGRAFEGGHESAGVTAPSTHWFLAEGATGTFFDTFVLLANPTATEAQVQATYLLPNGSTVEKSYTVAANSRKTIWVAGEDARLASTTMSTVVTSTNGVPIIVERSMWWPGLGEVLSNPVKSPIMWGEAHNSPGATETGTLWVVADGEIGPAPVYTATYYLIANTSPFAAVVRVTLLSERDNPPVYRDFTVPPNARLTVSAGNDFAQLPDGPLGGFGAMIESQVTTTTPVAAQIVVERAMYSYSVDGIFWAGGTNILAMKIR